MVATLVRKYKVLFDEKVIKAKVFVFCKLDLRLKCSTEEIDEISFFFVYLHQSYYSYSSLDYIYIYITVVTWE